MKYETVIMAGLLHDVGKFLQKGDFGKHTVKIKHPQFSARFVRAFEEIFAPYCDLKDLEILVMKHHESTQFPEEIRVSSAPQDLLPYAYLVSRADSYASSERGVQSDIYKDYKKRPLDSVFSRLDIGKELPDQKKYAPAIYSPSAGFPGDTSSMEQVINNHLKGFGQEVGRLKNSKDCLTFWVLYYRLYHLLMKYTWCIPSNSQEKVADVSLFDHLKVTSALAACLYKYHEAANDFTVDSIKDDNRDKVCLVAGDISGIQSYLFSSASIGSGAIAKRLRARSFLISMLTELVAYKLVSAYNLPLANVLMSSGGKFYLLLPNHDSISDDIGGFQKEVDRYLLDTYQGDLALNLASQPLKGKDFKSFGPVVSKVNQKLALKKKMPFEGVIASEHGWDEHSFIFSFYDKDGLGLCQGCGKEFATEIIEEKVYGSHCKRDLELGRRIPRLHSLLLEREVGQGTHISIAKGPGLKLLSGNREPEHKDEMLFMINQEKELPLAPVYFRYLANYVPVHEDGQPVWFTDLAQKSLGAKRLAYLKTDVDNLGKVLAFGLRTDEEDASSISRVATLSRMLDLFFSGWVNETVKETYPDCYIVFSGGDDLLIIGPWNQIMELALFMQTEFRRFVGNNPNLTLSTGIALARDKSTVPEVVEIAESLLEASKENILPGQKEGRNQLTVFGRTLSWDEYPGTLRNGKLLYQWLNERKLTKGDLWRLRIYDDMYQRYLKEKDTTGLSYMPFIAYQIGRKKKEGGYQDHNIIRWLEELCDVSGPGIKNLKVAVDYALLAIRGDD